MSHINHWDGNKNRIIRYYYYVQRGLALLNEFRYLIMAVFALYYMMKIDNPIILASMFFGSIPVLIFLGYLSVHHVAKVLEFLSVKFSTYWQKRNYELIEEQVELLKKIEALLCNTSSNQKTKE